MNSQYEMGKMCNNSLSDHQASVKWWEKAADQGNSDAQFELGGWLFPWIEFHF